MENRKGTRIYIEKRPPQFFPIFHFLFSIFLISAGCGAPGDPVPPSPPVPVAIQDLAADQAGDGVQLAFTLPSNSISGEKLPATPAVEILRGTVKPDGSSNARFAETRFRRFERCLAARLSCSGSPRFRGGSRHRVSGRTDLAGTERYCCRGACNGHHRLSNLPLGNLSFCSRFVSARSSAGQTGITRCAACFF